ncbi:hypothetical protein V6N12_073665 [Hibiscus sabdariffa]|uniref:Uncharacterized protein n=1 Tax=Hibiscus sabdariffa TaxID=183260 RepID=A0ABR2AUN4_9ROSI
MSIRVRVVAQTESKESVNGTVVSSEADKVGGETLRVVRDNPIFVLSADVLALGGQVRDRATCGETWNEWVGLADRVMESASERFDVVWCETALEQPRSSPVVFGWPSVVSLEAVGNRISLQYWNWSGTLNKISSLNSKFQIWILVWLRIMLYQLL